LNGYDGPTLRSIRESAHISLRRVARAAGMSHGHLSKVERGEPGRPVTHAVLNAYERVCGIRLTGVAGHQPAEADGWRRGHLSEARRRTLNAKIAAVAVGGTLGEQLSRIVDATGRILAPAEIGEPDLVTVEQAAAMCTRLDLRLGGQVCDQQARALLRWAIGLLAADATEPTAARLHAAIGALAHRAGWAAFDSESHDVARSLLTIALYAATRADDPDLRAHVLADLAAQHNLLGYPGDALQVVRFGKVDERVGPHVRMVLETVRARAYGVMGDAQACLRHLGRAEQEQAKAAASEIRGWRATIATPPQLAAATGHALADLARRTGTALLRDRAAQQLATAANRLGPERVRPAALCAARLALLHQETGDPEQAAEWGLRATELATGVGSARLTSYLTSLQGVTVQPASSSASSPAGMARSSANASCCSLRTGASGAVPAPRTDARIASAGSVKYHLDCERGSGARPCSRCTG
jgi:transcriptional regulator with XRE-family HTH domain